MIEKPLDDAMLKRIYEEQYLRLVQEGDALSGASMAEEEEEAGEAKPKTDTVRMLTELTVEEWGLLMRGAEHFVLAAGRPIIKGIRDRTAAADSEARAQRLTAAEKEEHKDKKLSKQ